MSALPPLSPRDKRIRWLSLVALLVLLPAALWLRSNENFVAWRAEQEFEPVIAQPGKPVHYGGAEWRLEGLYQLPRKDGASAFILAEFEAKVDDPSAFAAGMCRVRLSDRGEKRWSPQFLVPSDIRKVRPSLDERSTCGAATIKPLKAGDRVKMAETFLAPADITKFDLTISAANVRPSYLVLR